jgi:beta-glucanase (GH16 family)
MFHRRAVGLSMLFALAALVSLSFSTYAQEETMTPEPETTPIPAPDGWQLVWHDEFDAETLNLEDWTFDLGASGWGNNESQYYTNRPENVRLEDGMLIIEARREAFRSAQYTSARIKTQGLQTFQYGRIEARLKVPSGAGLWPAFWTLGENITTVGWPLCGEIDIMEYVGREPNGIFGTIHGPGYSGAQGISHRLRLPDPVADEFHTYAVEWSADEIRWFFDGEEYGVTTRADLGTREWVVDQPFFIILNLAVGGNFGGTISPNTEFPAQYLVDYVRVFQPE